MTTITKPSDLASAVNEAHAACLESARTAVLHAMRAGELLHEAKQLCFHGTWQQWLEKNFHGSKRTAQAYMRLHKNRGTIEEKAQGSALLTIDAALSLISKPRAGFETLADVIGFLDSYSQQPRWWCDSWFTNAASKSGEVLNTRLDRVTGTRKQQLGQLSQIITLAGRLQNACAESVLRNQRAIGQILNESQATAAELP